MRANSRSPSKASFLASVVPRLPRDVKGAKTATPALPTPLYPPAFDDAGGGVVLILTDGSRAGSP